MKKQILILICWSVVSNAMQEQGLSIKNLSENVVRVWGKWDTRMMWSADDYKAFFETRQVLMPLRMPELSVVLKKDERVTISEKNIWSPSLQQTVGVLVFLKQLFFDGEDMQVQIRNRGERPLVFRLWPPEDGNLLRTLAPSKRANLTEVQRIIFDQKQFERVFEE